MITNPFGVPISHFPMAGRRIGGQEGERSAVIRVEESQDPRVAWAARKEAQLKAEVRDVRAEQTKAMEYFQGRQTFRPNRPSWMNRVVDNAAWYTVVRWTAMLTDNKPRVVFTASREDQQDEADIASAAFYDDFVRHDYASAIEGAVLLSRIEKVAYIRQVPEVINGKLAITWTAVSDTQVYLNREASCIERAQLVMYEYHEPVRKVLERYPHLRGKLQTGDWSTPSEFSSAKTRPAPGGVGSGIASASRYPGQVGDVASSPISVPPYSGQASDIEQSAGGRQSVRMREFWMREPDKKVSVSALRWSAWGEPTTELATLSLYDEDGSVRKEEPLWTVVTSGNVVYELPLGLVVAMEAAAEAGGGLQIIRKFPARKVVRRTRRMPLYPGGRLLTLADDQVAYDGANPFGEVWPFVPIYAWRDPRKPRGNGDIDIIIPLCDAKNKLESQLMDAAQLTANPIWRLPLGRKTPNEAITNAPGAIIDEDPTSLKLGRREPGPNMPPYLMQLLAYWDQRISQITGLMDMPGNRSRANQAAETVSMYQDAASLPARQAIRELERALVKLGYQWLSLASQFYTDGRWVAVRDAVGGEKSRLFVGTSLTAPMVITAKAGSTLPASPSARLAFVTQLMQTPYGTLEHFAEVLAEAGFIDSASELIATIRRWVEEYKATRSPENPAGDPASLFGAPGLLALLMGSSARRAPPHAGRTHRQRTPRPNG
jgi:hypothetical protein